MSTAQRCSTPELRLSGELTIYTAADHAAALRSALGDEVHALRLDLSSVGEIDSAGLQLLLHVRGLLESRGGRLELQASPVVTELLRFCNLTGMASAA